MWGVVLLLAGLALIEAAVLSLAFDVAPLWTAIAVLATLSVAVAALVLWASWSQSE